MFIGIGLQMTGGGLPPFYPGASLALDFAAGRYKGSDGLVRSDLASVPGWSFSRTGAGTAEDTSGVYASFPTNTPRRTNKGLLVEEARTNLTLSSLDYAGANWTKTACAVGALVAGPDGAVSASPITESGSTGAVVETAAITVVSGSTYAVSKVFKRGNCDWVRVFVHDNALANGVRAWFNLAAVTASAGTTNSVLGTGWSHASAPQIQALGGGFYRCTVLVTTGATTLRTECMSASADNSTSRADVGSGAGVGAAYTLHNSDVTLGSFPLSPILTTGAAGTRGADTATSAISAIPEEATICWEGVLNNLPSSGNTARLFEVNDGTDANRLNIEVGSGGTAVGTVIVSGASTNIGSAGGITAGVPFKAALRRTGGAWRLYINGTAAGAGATLTLPTMNAITHGNRRSGSAYLNGFEKALVIYPHANPIARFTA